MIDRPDLRERLPAPLQPLVDLALNLRWSWHPDSAALLERVDPVGWIRSGRNPVAVLRSLPPERSLALSRDAEFLGALQAALEELRLYLSRPAWFDSAHPKHGNAPLAYFCAEFGVAQCLPIYAGGLGTLAGDHLKSASDLGVPMVGIGLAYRSGYFRQLVDAEGRQSEAYDELVFEDLPLVLERRSGGAPRTVDVPFPWRTVHLRIWRAQVGRVPLFLLDPDVPENEQEDREITRLLYGGDLETRIRQEILIGIGGVRALRVLGISPGAFHLNEGHSAFLLLERIREKVVEGGLDFETARKQVAASSIFTTHTPVPAGFDLFPPGLLWRYFGPYGDEVGVSFEQFLALGTEERPDGYRPFNMAVLALRGTAHRNGVSRLHGKISRAMWRSEWPDLSEDEVPIGSVTNGVHLGTWISPELGALLDEGLGHSWREGDGNDPAWGKLASIPDPALWAAHRAAKERLIAAARARYQARATRQGSEEEVRRAPHLLNPDHLIVGFARRFAPYKRATLILRDRERLRGLLLHAERPVQFLFAGKAHPQNQEGKELIREILAFARGAGVLERFLFIEDYDIELARLLVQGVDVWLNNPRRPQEASGTSGMKAAANGVLNLSVLDGWWVEGYRPEVGWAIGDGEEGSEITQDERESLALYQTLENEVIPAYYDRDPRGIPPGWLSRMRDSIRLLAPEFNTHRMVREYVERYYLAAGAGRGDS